MPRGPVPSRTAPKEEISTELVKHNRPFTGPKASEPRPVTPSAERKAKYFEQAKKDLLSWTPATAVDRMSMLGVGLLEMYLLAEEVTQARPAILRYFPKPGAKARERYLPALAHSGAEETDNG